jgi:hypothetical protein
MARIALTAGVAAGVAAAGFFTGGLAWTAFTPLEGLIGGASIGLAVGASIFLRPHQPGQAPLQDLNVSSSANGAAIPFGYGTARLAGQVIWSPGITYRTESMQSSGKGASTPAGYVYFGTFAAAFGEGPATVNRIWADSRLIYKGGQAFGSFSAWNPDAAYLPEDLVSYYWDPGVGSLVSLFQCLVPNSNITPPGNSLYWAIASYAFWDSTVQYVPGDTVAYPGKSTDTSPGSGAIYACTQASQGDHPDSSSKWETLQPYYGFPTLYPGNETQLPNPLIQGVEGAANTPAFRGICYVVYEDLPLANFGNRIPNLRAEVTYT